MKHAVAVNCASIDEASERLGVAADDVLFLGACGVLERRREGVTEASLSRFEEEARRATGKGEPLAAAVERAVVALRSEWDRALLERGPSSPRRVFGAVHLGEHPDGTVVYAVEDALDRIVSRNLHILGGGRVRQLIVDRSLLERWGSQPDLLESIAPEVIQVVPAGIARRLRIVPVAADRTRVVVAAAAQPSTVDLDELRFMIALEVDVVVVAKDALDAAIERYYGVEEGESLSLAMCEVSVEPRIDRPAKKPRIELPDTGERAGFGFVAARKSGGAAPLVQAVPAPPPPPPPPGYTSFDEAKDRLQVDEEELKKLVSTGELRGFRDGMEIRFKDDDIASLKQERVTEPTIILAHDCQITESSDDLVLEDSREEPVAGLKEFMSPAAACVEYAPEPEATTPCAEIPAPFDPFASGGGADARETEAVAFELEESGADDERLETRSIAAFKRPETPRPAPAAAPAAPPTGAFRGAMPPQSVAMPAGRPASYDMATPRQAPVTGSARSGVGLSRAMGALAGGLASGVEELSKLSAAPAAPANRKPAPLPADGEKQKQDDEPETFERKATVRYYSQMYAQRNYPLLVVVSKRSIQKIVKQHVAQVEGKKSFKIRRGNPFVQIRPILPGCLCVPAEITLDVKPKVAEAKFWVTPTAEGELEEARVEVLYEGKVVSTIEVPTRVTTQALAKVTGSAAFLTTTAGPFFEAFGVSVKKEGASFVADVLAHLAGGSFRYGIAGLLGFVALVFFLRRRPKAGPETEGFFDWGVEDEVDGDPLVRAVKAKLVVAGPEGLETVDLIHASTLIGSAPTAHVRVRGARSLAEVACELRYEDTFVLRARSSGIKVDGEDLRDGDERKLRRDAAIDLDSGRVTLGLLDVRQDPAVDGRRDAALEALVRARPTFESELRALFKRTASEPLRVALLEALMNGWTDPHGWRRVRASLGI